MEDQFLMKKDEYNYAVLSEDILRIAASRDKEIFDNAELQAMQSKGEVRSEGYTIQGDVTYETYDLTEIGKVLLHSLSNGKNPKPMIRKSHIAEIKSKKEAEIER